MDYGEALDEAEAIMEASHVRGLVLRDNIARALVKASVPAHDQTDCGICASIREYKERSALSEVR